MEIARDKRAKIEFTLLLNQCILDGIKSLLGEAGTNDLLLHLQLVRYAQNPKEFHDNLRPILDKGTQILEKMIVEQLFQRLDIPYREGRAFDFERCVKQARSISIIRMKQTD